MEIQTFSRFSIKVFNFLSVFSHLKWLFQLTTHRGIQENTLDLHSHNKKEKKKIEYKVFGVKFTSIRN
jgi:hypothetical protein